MNNLNTQDFSPERPNEDLRTRVVNALKANGFDHEPTLDLLGEWMAELEAEADKSKDQVLALINIDRQCARLYFEAGNTENAKYAFENALLQATQEHRQKLAEAIEAEMKFFGI